MLIVDHHMYLKDRNKIKQMIKPLKVENKGITEK